MANYLLSFHDVFNTIRATLGDTLLIIIGLVFIFALMYFLQYKGFQIFMLVVFTIVIMAGGVFSVIKINKYHSASGGIVGKIESILRPNQASKTKDKIGFKFDNLMMTKDADENYSVYIISEEIIELKEDEDYVVLVNNEICSFDYQSSNYIEFEYNYLFMDKKHETILDDTLYIQIVFYKTRTELSVYTTGGVEARNLWQAYFSKNNFEITLEKVTSEAQSAFV